MKRSHVSCTLLLFPCCFVTASFTWGSWSSWSSGCFRLCSEATGVQRRFRQCMVCVDKYGCTAHQEPNICHGSEEEIQKCYVASECHGIGNFTGQWSVWKDTGHCETTPANECDISGVQKQTRDCLPSSKSEHYKAVDCPMTSDRIGRSRHVPCMRTCGRVCRWKRAIEIPYGMWGHWSKWTCSEECNKPSVLAYRSRHCSGLILGYSCPKSAQGLGEIDVKPCQTDDGDYRCEKWWSEWSNWSSCTSSCQQSPRIRYRQCSHGYGKPCPGGSTESSACPHTELCEDPNNTRSLSQWSDWSDHCSATCGSGVKTRYRVCPYGAQCYGHTVDIQRCKSPVSCALDGGWTYWTVWSCTVECGGGNLTRSRTCTNPVPVAPGRPCLGKGFDIGQRCNTQECGGSRITLPANILEKINEKLKSMYYSYQRTEHQSVAFLCNSDMMGYLMGKYYSIIHWVKNGQPLQMDMSRMTYEDGDLLIQSVTSADNGVYLCQIEWRTRTLQTLGVYSLVVKSSHTVKVTLHQNFQLPCNGAALGLLYHGLQQVWFHNGEVYEDYGFTPPQTINIEYFKDVSPDIAGLWECVINEPLSERVWVTNRVNITVILPQTWVEKALADPVYLYGSIAAGVCLLIAIAVCCLYQDKKESQDAETELGEYQKLATESVDLQPDSDNRSFIITESSSNESDEESPIGTAERA